MDKHPTALAKVMEDVINLDQSLNPQSYEATYMHIAYNKVLEIITQHLPYERETMEECYEDGKINMRCGEPKTATDYFNQTYTQDAK